MEQMSITLRYVVIDDDGVKIRESFLGFVSVERSTGENLADELLDILREKNLPLGDMRGQGYDNGANMKGDRAGVQRRIRNLNPRAFFVPCSAHSLNLVVNDMAKSSLQAANFFNIVQKIFVFFSASTLRWAILLKHIKGLTIKPLSDTRWESRIDALKPLRFQIDEIYDALLDIYNDVQMDTMVRDEASGLVNQMKKFNFLCSLVIWYNVLNHINPLSKMMQAKDFVIPTAVELLKNSLTFFQSSRCDEAFSTVLTDAAELALDIDAETNFTSVPRARRRKQKRQFDYEHEDETIDDPKQKFKVEMYFHLIDCAVNSLQQRFSHLQDHNKYFDFLYDIYIISKI